MSNFNDEAFRNQFGYQLIAESIQEEQASLCSQASASEGKDHRI